MAALSLGEIVVSVKSDTSHLVKGFKRAESTVSKSARTMATAIKTLTAAYIGLNAIDLAKSMGRQIDTMTLIDTKLKLATKSTEELTTAQNALFKISQETRTTLTGSVDLFERLTRSTRDYSIEQKEILELTRTINKAMIISGGTAESMNASIIQLGQAFSADFQSVGQELASIREQTPRLYQAFLEGTGKTSKEFKKLAEDGELSTKIILEALQSQGIAVNEEFQKVNKTIDQSSTNAQSAILRIIGEFDKVVDVTGSVTGAIDGFTDSIKDIDSSEIEETARQIKVVAVTIGSLTIGTKAYTTATALAASANAIYGGSFGAVNRAIVLTTVSTKALSLATKAIPYVAIASAVYLIADAWIGAEDAAKKYQDTVDKNSKGFTGQGILADYKYETEIKNLVSAFDTMEAREKAYYATKGTNAEKYYKDLYDKSVSTYNKIESDVVESSNNIFATISEKTEEASTKAIKLTQKEIDAKIKGHKEVNAHVEAYYERQAELHEIALALDKAGIDFAQETQNKKYQTLAFELDIIKEQSMLIRDMDERGIATAEANFNIAQAELDHLLALGDITKTQHAQKMALQKQYRDKVIFDYSYMGQTIDAMGNSMESNFASFFDYLDEGALDFGELMKGILHDIYMDLIRNLVIKQLVSGITSALTGGGGLTTSDYTSVSEATAFAGYTPNAVGNVYSSPSLSAHSNSIVSSPTPFYFASGGVPNLGVMGEAGSEAIMPLTRTSGGDLGVKVQGTEMNISIINNTDTVASAQSDEQGDITIILEAVADSINRNTSSIRPAIQNLVDGN